MMDGRLQISAVTLITAGFSLVDIEAVLRIVALGVTTTLSIIVFIRNQKRLKKQEDESIEKNSKEN